MQSHSHCKMPCVTPSLAEEDAPQTPLMQEERPSLCLPTHSTGSELGHHRTPWLLQLEETCVGQQGQRSFCFA